MKTVGIIGGLGPETTAKFYLQIGLMCQKKKIKQRPNILISSVPISFKLEEEFIKDGKGKKEFLSLLIDSAKKLEKGGADFIVIPCNTAHVFIKEIKNSVSIPVLSIVDESVKILKEKNINNVGLLSTPATIKNKLFDKQINLIKPTKVNQEKMGIIINNILNNQNFTENKLELLQIIRSIAKKSDALLLACTDLQLLIPENKINGVQVFDTMQILADATVKELLI